ncbi:MAG: Hpt domain-containing protein [SAR324 cluster bacterium]|nr:Hpt domain-containing protein [SAR324 cluster bacterium]
MDDDNPLKITVQIDPDLKDLIPSFLKNRAEDIKKVQAYLAENDFESIQMLGHSLKGNGAGYGFDELSVIGQELERAAIDKSAETIDKVRDRMSAYLENLEVVYEE